MKTKSIVILLLLSGLSILIWAFSFSLAQTENISFDDPMLELALREELQMEEIENFDKSLTYQVTELDLSSNQITSLDGLQAFERLSSLDLSHNKLETIEELGHFSELESLNLEDNLIEDVKPLNSLTTLLSLNIRENSIDTLDTIYDLTQLKTLNARENKLVDVMAITNFKYLENLDISYNYINSIAPLMELPTLRSQLYIEGNPITDIHLLSNIYDSILEMDVPRPEFLIVFSHDAGLYNESFELELSTQGSEDGEIRYTTDNREVQANDLIYTEPITIEKNTTISAQFFPESNEKTNQYANSYLFNETATLPIISLATHRPNFFNNQYGIYVPGIYFNEQNPTETGNYMQRGNAWERPIFMQMFDTNGEAVLSQHAGVRIHAETDPTVDRKSLRLYARSEYGEARFQYPFFGDNERSIFNRLVLHNAGQDWNRSLIHDPFIHELVSHLNLETQNYSPVNFYFNGENWGIYHLRERYDSHYFRFKKQVKEEDLDLIKGNDVLEGNNLDYENLLAYIRENGTTTQENYHYIASQIDIDNFIDYTITQIYSANTEWPNETVYSWRERPYGKWRWALADLESDISNSEIGVNHNTIAWIKNNQTEGSASFLLTSLLLNDDFRSTFIQRFAHQLNTTFEPNRANKLLESMLKDLQPNIQDHINHWNEPATYEIWQGHTEDLLDFVTNRPANLKEHLSTELELEQTVEVQVNEANVDHAYFASYHLPLQENWTGNYFKDAPLSIEIPDEANFYAISNNDAIVTIDTENKLHFTGDGTTTVDFIDHNDNHLFTLTVTIT